MLCLMITNANIVNAGPNIVISFTSMWLRNVTAHVSRNAVEVRRKFEFYIGFFDFEQKLENRFKTRWDLLLIFLWLVL